jgi:PleD family two-component response regulator
MSTGAATLGRLSRANAASADTDAGEESRMRPNILVVDDSDEVRLLASRILEREGYQVTAAGLGVSALELLQNFVPDLVVSDIMMPEVDGYRCSSASAPTSGSWPCR